MKEIWLPESNFAAEFLFCSGVNGEMEMDMWRRSAGQRNMREKDWWERAESK